MKSIYIRFVRWLLGLLGGILVGGGLVLHGQVAVAHYLRDEVSDTFFLWRGVGKLTFMFQDEVTKTALTLHELPASALADADRAAWVLVAIGAMVALTAVLIRERKKPARK